MLKKTGIISACLAAIFGWTGQACANDLDDGITEYTDDAIAGDDAIGNNKDNNINFIVVDAIGKAKTSKKDKAGKTVNKKEITNLVDPSKETNTNSIVVEAGSDVDKVTNIVIEK